MKNIAIFLRCYFNYDNIAIVCNSIIAINHNTTTVVESSPVINSNNVKPYICLKGSMPKDVHPKSCYIVLAIRINVQSNLGNMATHTTGPK